MSCVAYAQWNKCDGVFHHIYSKAVVVTATYNAVHGAPIHIGDPSMTGVEDIYKTESGEPSDIGDVLPCFGLVV